MENKAKLSIGDRFALSNVLPKETNLGNMKLVNSIFEKIQLTEKESTDCKLQTIKTEDGAQMTWVEPAEKAELEFTTKEIALILNSLKELDTNNKVSKENIGLFEAFNYE